MKQLAERVARVEHSQAKLEGLLEGLREAIKRAGRCQLKGESGLRRPQC